MVQNETERQPLLSSKPEPNGVAAPQTLSLQQQPPVPAPRSFRINRLLGRIVPLVLAVYMGFAYRLAIPQYAISHLYKTEHRHAASAGYIVFNHALFLIAFRSYLRVYLAFDAQSGPSWLVRLLGRRLVSAVEREPKGQHNGEGEAASDEIWECDAKGERLRCWRDDCGGRVKGPRTRHCGDCQTCRPGLDHHCPWFDADVCLGTTLYDFSVFLGVIPVLLFTALGPLSPLAWRHAKAIWRFARQSREVKRIWWERKRGWIGGPIYRWAVGWIIGASRIPSQKPPPGQSPLYGVPSAGPPVILAIALLLVPIASGLLISTLSSLAKGETTIEVSRRRALLRSAASARSTADVSSPSSSSPANSIQHHLARFYSVPITSANGDGHGRVVVAEPGDAGSAYDVGSARANLLAAFGLGVGNSPSLSQGQTQNQRQGVSGQTAIGLRTVKEAARDYPWRLLGEPFKQRLRAEVARRQ